MSAIKMKYRFYVTVLACVAVGFTACEDEPTVKRSKNLNIYGPATVYVGDISTFEAPLYTLNDERIWDWEVTGPDADPLNAEGEFFDVSFNQLGTYTVSLFESDREGSMEVEAVSKLLSLDGASTVVTESAEENVVFIPFAIDNFVANEITVNYTVGGTAVEGVDYEVLSDNPIVLDENSSGEDYGIYIRLIPDVDPDATGETVTVTLTSVTTELADEVILNDDEEEDVLWSSIEIVDDTKIVSVRNIVPERIEETSVVSFEVVMSSPSAENVTVNYSISGTGVNDATPDGAGTLTFFPGETTKLIYLQFNNAAFFDSQEVRVSLNSITSIDNETELNDSKDEKVFLIVVE